MLYLIILAFLRGKMNIFGQLRRGGEWGKLEKFEEKELVVSKMFLKK
jgi:hypothetical protein